MIIERRKERKKDIETPEAQTRFGRFFVSADASARRSLVFPIRFPSDPKRQVFTRNADKCAFLRLRRIGMAKQPFVAHP